MGTRGPILSRSSTEVGGNQRTQCNPIELTEPWGQGRTHDSGVPDFQSCSQLYRVLFSICRCSTILITSIYPCFGISMHSGWVAWSTFDIFNTLECSTQTTLPAIAVLPWTKNKVIPYSGDGLQAEKIICSCKSYSHDHLGPWILQAWQLRYLKYFLKQQCWADFEDIAWTDAHQVLCIQK